jgi:hypothetical protein
MANLYEYKNGRTYQHVAFYHTHSEACDRGEIGIGLNDWNDYIIKKVNGFYHLYIY